MINATLYNDPACPWGYSANPALRFLEWRYGDQLDWRLVMIVLREQPNPSYTPERSLVGQRRFQELYRMPFSLTPKSRAAATHRGCRAVVAAGIVDPGSEFRVMRALQLANFNTDLLLDDDEAIRAALRGIPGVDAGAIAERLDDDEVEAEYRRQRAEARTAAGTPIVMQGKHSTSDGPERFTAPSVVFEQDGRRLDAGGWQTALSYDVVVANLDPAVRVTPPPESPAPLLERFPDGLTTAEVAALLATGPDYVPDFDAAERALKELAASGGAQRLPLGSDAIWLAPSAEPWSFAAAAAATA